MLKIEKYVIPDTLDEAYDLYQKQNNVILGGMLWLRLEDKRINTAIDLTNLGLNKIEENDQVYKLGTYVSLRDFETHPGLNNMTDGAAGDSVSHIVGVQFRNMATIGGSVFGRFGFSDVLTILSALDAEVILYKNGIMPIEDFSSAGKIKDILTHVIIPKQELKTAYLSQRNSATDFPVLNVAVAQKKDHITVSVGARPLRTVTFNCPVVFNESSESSEIEKFADEVCGNIIFASNSRASKEYRKKIAPVLIRRAIIKAVRGNK